MPKVNEFWIDVCESEGKFYIINVTAFMRDAYNWQKKDYGAVTYEGIRLWIKHDGSILNLVKFAVSYLENAKIGNIKRYRLD